MENEVVYVATDEKDLSFFDPFREKFRVRFLSDYYERAGVSEISPNVLGMLEQVGCVGKHFRELGQVSSFRARFRPCAGSNWIGVDAVTRCSTILLL